MLTTTLFDPTARTQKADLIPPVLMVLASAAHQGVLGVPPGFLRSAVGSVVQQSAADRAVTAADRVSRFDRAMLNLTSHRSLTTPRWVRRVRVGDGAASTGLMRITARGKAALFDHLVAMFDDAPLDIDMPRSSDDSLRHTEARIAFPALLALARLERERAGPVSTTAWRQAVTRMLQLTPSDEKTLANRSDRSIDQTVRNLISHETLGKKGWIRRTSNGYSRTTLRGKARLVDEFLVLGLLPSVDFSALRDDALVSKAMARPRVRRALR